MRVPFVDVRAATTELSVEIEEAVLRVVRSGSYVLGPEVSGFERELATSCEVAHAVGVGSGLDALQLLLRAHDIGPGDDVLVPAHTFVATWLAVMHLGARPVPVDVDPDTALVTAAGCAASMTGNTRAILAVDLFGQPVDGPALAELAKASGLLLFEDAAQAHGARFAGRPAGSFGEGAAFSFYPSKNLGALGDAGAITTSRPDIAARLRALRNYGGEGKYVHEELGTNSRLDELQAAVLRVKLRRLTDWNLRRAAIARRYAAELPEGLGRPVVREGAESVWHLYVVRHPQRDALRAALAARGIETGLHYPRPPHLTGACAHLGHVAGSFPVAERWAREGLSLPIGPHLPDHAVTYMIDAAHAALAEVG